jgi:hypothetical protein
VLEGRTIGFAPALRATSLTTLDGGVDANVLVDSDSLIGVRNRKRDSSRADPDIEAFEVQIDGITPESILEDTG